jgi:hypothetical protein
MKFQLGQIVWTRGVNEKVVADRRFGKFVFDSLKRHKQGDWGDLGEADRKENELSLEKGFRLLSAYNHSTARIWIITEADRSATTILFPEEY